MAHSVPKGWTLADLAAHVDGTLTGGDPEARVERAVPAGTADPEGFTFARDKRYLERALVEPIGVVLVPRGTGPLSRPTVEVDSPELAFFRLIGARLAPLPAEPGIHPTAVVSPDAIVSPEASVGAFAVIVAGAVVKGDAAIHPFSYIGPDCKVEAGCEIQPHAVLLRDVWLKEGSIVYPGAVLGADGFGFVAVDGRQVKKPHGGNVEIGPHAEIGANSAVDRAPAGTTVVGEDVKIDNLVQIGHGTTIGAHTVIAALCGIAGSCRIGEWVSIGGQAGMAERSVIPSRTMLGGQSGVTDEALPGPGAYFGTPALPHREAFRKIAAERKLPDLLRQVKTLEERLAALEARLGVTE